MTNLNRKEVTVSNAIVTQDEDALAFIQNPSPEVLQEVLGQGNLSKLSSTQRLEFLAAVCRSIGLNPLTRPFDIMTLQGKVVVYAKKDCTEQLRKINNVSVSITSQDIRDDVLIVTARAIVPSGRFDEDIGAVSVKGLAGEALSNARMKAITKAKRRVTLSICGLGFLDESEITDAQHQPQMEPNKSQPISNYPEKKPESPEAVEAEVVVTHWSELLPDAWRKIQLLDGPFKGMQMVKVSQDVEAATWAGANLDPSTVQGMALFASRWLKIERLLAGLGMDTGEFQDRLIEARILDEGQTVFDVSGERLTDLFKFAKALQAEAQTQQQ